MKKRLLVGLLFTSSTVFAQSTVVDTLAIQDFETVPATPTWNYTGVLSDVQSGFAPSTSSIPNTPLGINGSQAWHVVSISGGNIIEYDNITIPPSYDSVRVNFSLEALNLLGATGGPDDLDYVLVEYSVDNGTTWVPRLRIQGAIANNSFWAYDATGVAAVSYLPATTSLFQPVTSGLQVTEGYSFCEISFPGSISQVAIRITPRSSSSSDSWLIDNLVITGENYCIPTSSSITATACASYTAPSGAVYTNSGIITDVISNAQGCDSTITIDLAINSNASTDVQTACGTFTWIDGNEYTSSTNTPTWTITNSLGCDSTITLDLTVNSLPDNSVVQTGALLTAVQIGASYAWLNCDNNTLVSGAINQSFTPTVTGNYAVELTQNGCTVTSSCFLVDFTGLVELSIDNKVLVKIIDLMGRETEFKPNVPLIFIYNDGTRERVMKITN